MVDELYQDYNAEIGNFTENIEDKPMTNKKYKSFADSAFFGMFGK